MRKQKEERHYCGNCSSHNTYEYPDTVFCMTRFLRSEKATTPTLGTCNEWRAHVQTCFCVEDASKKRARK